MINKVIKKELEKDRFYTIDDFITKKDVLTKYYIEITNGNQTEKSVEDKRMFAENFEKVLEVFRDECKTNSLYATEFYSDDGFFDVYPVSYDFRYWTTCTISGLNDEEIKQLAEIYNKMEKRFEDENYRG